MGLHFRAGIYTRTIDRYEAGDCYADRRRIERLQLVWPAGTRQSDRIFVVEPVILKRSSMRWPVTHTIFLLLSTTHTSCLSLSDILRSVKKRLIFFFFAMPSG